jgi:non-ribosomal peptide synthetase component F
VTLTWFRPPQGDDPGTLNLCYHAVDVAVIRGAAGETAVRHAGGELDYAVLLEEVAALGGALRGLGVTEASTVGVALDDPLDRLLAQLAVARVGAAVVDLDDDAESRIEAHRPYLLVTSRPLATGAHVPPVVLVRGLPVADETRDLDWEVAVRAGRTDPAPCAPVPPGSTAYVAGVEVAAADLPGHESDLGRDLAALADRTAVDLRDRG